MAEQGGVSCAQGVEADVAQRLLPSGEGGQGSGQHLGSLAARLSSKVARAEARQGMAPAPESALNFRPAVSRLVLLLC